MACAWRITLGPADLLTQFAMDELLACLVVVVILFVCRRIISWCRHCNDEYDRRRPILVSSSRNVSYTQGFYAPVKSTPTIPSYNGHTRPFQASSSHNIPDTQGFYAPVKSTPTIPGYNGHTRPFQASSSHNIPDTRDFYVPTKSTVKTLTISKHVSSIPPPRAGPSSVKVQSNALLSEEGEYITHEERRQNARRMKREEQEALSLAKQARQRRDFSAEARHKQDARVRKFAMERLNKEAATAIFNQKNKVLWPIATRFQSHAY